MPVHVSAHVCQASTSKTVAGGVVLSRGRVSLVAPGAEVARRDEELDVDVCLAPVLEVEDMYPKSASRLVRAVVEGRSASLVGIGASSSGKSYVLFGSQQADGLAHVCATGLVTSMQQRKDEVAKVLRDAGVSDSSSQYEFFIETSMVEMYKEDVYDLYDNCALKEVTIDEMDGPSVVDAVWAPANIAKGSAEMLAQITEAVSQRETARADVGRISERSALVLSFRISQRVPGIFLHSTNTSEGKVYHDESVFVSTLRIVVTPSSDRLTKDPEVLRLREGLAWNKSLLAMSRLVSGLAAAKDPSEIGITTAEAIRASTLTRLLVDDIGGPCVCSAMLFFSPGDYASNCATLSLGRSFVRITMCCPYSRDEFSRLAIARQRSVSAVAVDVAESSATVAAETGIQMQAGSQLPVIEKKMALEESAAAVARVHEIEGLLLQERERVANMVEETRKHKVLMAKREEEEETSLQAREELQEELLKSEEKRLEVSTALIDLQLEHTQMQEELEETRYRLEKRIIELEAQQVANEAESKVAGERQGNLELAAQELTAENDAVKQQMESVTEELQTELTAVRKALDEAESARDSLQKAVAEHVQQSESLRHQLEEYEALSSEAKDKPSITEKDVPELTAKRIALERELSERTSDLTEAHRELESLRSNVAKLQVQLQDSRQTFQTRIEGCMQRVSDLAAVANLSAIDPDSPAVDLNIFKANVSELVEEISNERVQRDKQVGEQVESLHRAFTNLRRRHAALVTGYRTLRYQAEDAVAATGAEACNFVHEDSLVGSLDDVAPDPGNVHAEVASLRERCVQLQQKLYTASVQQGMNTYGESHNDALSKLKAENEELKVELESLRVSRHPTTGAEDPEKLRSETELLRSRLSEVEDFDKTRASIGYELAETKKELDKMRAAAAGASAAQDFTAEMSKMQHEFKTYMAQVGAEYQTEITRLKSENIEAEERASAAEEYMSQSTVAYQKEIMRLRALLTEHAPNVEL